MDDFILRAFFATIGISAVSGSLGCFVIWKRMSYFSESISLSALLGVALGLVSGLNVHLGLLVVSVLFAVLIVTLQKKNFLSSDAILGIFSHISLSLGVVILALVGNANTDYFSLLFGDILSISNQDIVWIYAIVVLVGILLSVFWQRLLLLTLNEEIGVATGLNRTRYQLLLMLMIALTVSVSVQIVGVLLITSLLIIPPAIARVFSSSPIQMVFLSIVISMIAMVAGLNGSMHYDVATGPSIVIVLGILFALSQILPKKRLS
jgi:zinc transport system permease protein